jgi:hypothetical protein
MDIPSIDVVRHWIAWDNDEHDLLRLAQFDAWLTLELNNVRQSFIDQLHDACFCNSDYRCELENIIDDIRKQMRATK